MLPGKRSERCSTISSGTTTFDALVTAGAGVGAGASTAAGVGLASGDASGDADSAAAVKPATAKERATKEVNNFFIVVKLRWCVNDCLCSRSVFFVVSNLCVFSVVLKIKVVVEFCFRISYMFFVF